MPRSLTLVLLLATSVSLFAQTRIDAGVSVGHQAYENPSDDPRFLPGAEVMWRRDPFNLQFAFEYADLSQQGAILAFHTNAIYRWKPNEHLAILAGPGFSYINADTVDDATWNASAEIAYTAAATELFVRVRQYDYTFTGFREFASPRGPAVYLGVRFKVRG